LTHDVALLMAGIRPPDNATSPHRRNRLKVSNVHYLFSVRNMFFSRIFDAGGPHPGFFGNFGHFKMAIGLPPVSGLRIAPSNLIPAAGWRMRVWGANRLQIANTLSARWKNTTKVPKMFISMQTSPHNRRVRCDPGSTP